MRIPRLRHSAPVARREAKQTTLHGHTLVDDYAWLREKTSPEVIAYLDAENAYTDAVMAGTEALQKTLYDEMVSHIKETDVSVPFPDGGYLYYSRTEQVAAVSDLLPQAARCGGCAGRDHPRREPAGRGRGVHGAWGLHGFR